MPDKGLKTVYNEYGKTSIEIADNRVMLDCANRIEGYISRINRINASGMDCKTLIEYLERKNEDISLTKYARSYINKLKNDERNSSAGLYSNMLSSLQKFFAKDEIYFHELTAKNVEAWIDTLRDTRRAKTAYSACLKAMITSARKKYNDEDSDIIRIKVNPFSRVDIPKSKRPVDKKSIPPVSIRRVLTEPVEINNCRGASRIELSRDVATLIFCLAGINSADLYDLKADALHDDWKLCYNRKKTRDKSDTGSYMEITVPVQVRSLVGKYKGKDGRLFSFAGRFSDVPS